MYELKSSRKSTRNKKIVARIKQQSIKAQEFFCVYFRVSLCYHSHNRKVKLERNEKEQTYEIFVRLLLYCHKGEKLLKYKYRSGERRKKNEIRRLVREMAGILCAPVC